MTEHIPKISIVIPVYNVEAYLEECLDSVINQTLRDIEIICVDDGSSDQSVGILREYAEKDKRIRVICHEKNLGIHMTRKTGVIEAKGKYILFLDSDDSYHDHDAFLRLYTEIEKRQVDILQFGTRIIPEQGAPASGIAWLEKNLKPYTERVNGNTEEMLAKVFVERKWSWNLLGKVYKTSIVKKAYHALPNIQICNAEDVYATFAILYYCGSFIGVEDCSFYNYRYGRGGYGKSVLTIDFFERLCSRHRIIEALYAFLDEQHSREDYAYMLERTDQEFLNNTIFQWKNKLPAKKRGEGFDLLCKTWTAERVISVIAKNNWYECRAIAQAVKEAKCLKRRTEKIKTIAIYYHWLTFGGVQRVISLLLPKWLEAGYKIVLITDTEPGDQDYRLPEGIKRIVIPDFRRIHADNYSERAQVLARILIENKVDLVDYHAWNNGLLLWDTLLIKTLGIAVNYHTHSIGIVGLQSGDPRMAERYAIASLMDSVSTLSRADNELYRCVNSNVHYICNPLYEEEIKRLPAAPLHEKTIIWVARISREKRPLDAIKVFSLVHDRVPDAKLIMLGDGDEAIKSEMRRTIEENHLEGCVIWPGAVSDVQSYYLQAGVAIMTSEFEGYSMVIQEALSYGIPVVTYRMDYLELIRQCPSIISVDQMDAQAMADELVRILQNDEDRKRIGAQSRQEILEFARNSCVNEKWKDLFSSIEEGRADTACPESQKILMDTMMDYMVCGSKAKNHEIMHLKNTCAEKEKQLRKELAEKERQIQKERAKNERILSSRSYKLARLMGIPVRLLRKVLKRT